MRDVERVNWVECNRVNLDPAYIIRLYVDNNWRDGIPYLSRTRLWNRQFDDESSISGYSCESLHDDADIQSPSCLDIWVEWLIFDPRSCLEIVHIAEGKRSPIQFNYKASKSGTVKPGTGRLLDDRISTSHYTRFWT